LKKYIIITLLVLLASMLAVGCTGPNNEKNYSQISETPSHNQASSQQPASSTEYQDPEWIASVQKQYPILKTDFDRMSNVTNQYNISSMNNCDPDAITRYGQNLINDVQNALEEDNKYSVSPKLLKDQKDWETALQICNSAGNSWILTAKDIKNGRDLNNTTNDSNLVSALGSTGAATYNMKRIATSLGST
jgi:hypothetical protein